MASKSSKQGGRPGSPTKKGTSVQQNNASVSGLYQNEDYSNINERDLVRGLTEREVENDHLKTTVFALNEQLQVCPQFQIKLYLR